MLGFVDLLVEFRQTVISKISFYLLRSFPVESFFYLFVMLTNLELYVDLNYVLCFVGINAHEGFNVGMQAGIALAICFSILGSFAITVNIIKRKCVKTIP